jgi:uncharacterized protein (DUF4415 family)
LPSIHDLEILTIPTPTWPLLKRSLVAAFGRSVTDIVYSDVAELDDEVFAQPFGSWPPKKETITIRVDSDVLGCSSVSGPAIRRE